WAKILLINTLAVIVLLVVLGVASRVILHKVYNRSFDSSLIEDNRYYTSAGIKPNASGMVWGKLFNSDEFGGRKGCKAFDKKKKTRLFIGDSVTEGVGVDDSSTFTSFYAKHIDSLNILNISLIGWSTYDYVNAIKSFVADTTNPANLEHITLVYCLNDVYGPVKTGDLPKMGRQGFIGWIAGFLQQNYATYKLVKLFAFKHANSYYRYDKAFYKEGNPYFETAMRLLKTADSLCNAAHIGFDVLILPYRSQLAGPDDKDQTPQIMMAKYCTQNHIRFAYPSIVFNNLPRPEGLYLFSDEIHFSERGHKAIGYYLLSQ
ncbi:MAG TPA: hypothetical protein VG603_10635, partial [Chitinophagales bacterium]|nr:hypothetical protein [Chitinophagales bacterium]